MKRIFVRDLSPASDGNANGIGLADFTAAGWWIAWIWQRPMSMPLPPFHRRRPPSRFILETDRECLAACARTTGVADPRALRVVRIKSTAALDCIQVSQSLESEMLKQTHLSRISPWRPLTFSSSGNLGNFSATLQIKRLQNHLSYCLSGGGPPCYLWSPIQAVEHALYSDTPTKICAQDLRKETHDGID
ncbi:MAG: hypothetical protein R2860_03705 [Desulfobacterales bacterium]